MPPLLSICVPTYNRAGMLRVMLGAILPQVAAEGGRVEFCLSDNASTDATPEVIRAAADICPIRASRNASNLGPIGNVYRVTNEMAAGQYVWVLGDDDLVRPGAVQRIVEAIEGNSDLDAFYLNFNSARHHLHWPAEAPGGYDGPCDYTVHADTRNRRIERWEDLVLPENSFCTQLYVHILRRSIWSGLAEKGRLGKPYTSFRWTWPHTCMAAKAMFGRPALYVGEPSLTIFNRQTEWAAQAPRMVLEHLPRLIGFFAGLGLAPQRAAELQDAVDYLGVWCLKGILLGFGPRPRISALGFLLRNVCRPRAWRLLGSALSGLSSDRTKFSPPGLGAAAKGQDRRAA